MIAEGTINEKLKDGYSWEAGQSLEFPVGVRPTGAVRIRNKGNKLVTVEFTVQTNADNIALVEVPETGETVYVQLVKATLVPKEPLSVDLDEDVAKSLRIEPKPPFFVGHEVRQQAGTVDPENVTVLEGTSRILKVTYKGEDYTVILRALLPNVHP